MKRNLIVLLACLAAQVAIAEPSLVEKNALGDLKNMELLVIGAGGCGPAPVWKLAQRTSCLSNLHQPSPDKPKESPRKITRDQS